MGNREATALSSASLMSEEEKPVIKDGKRGQILRFGEHDIRLIRRELHLAVDEELRFTPEDKEMIRSQNKKIGDIKATCMRHQAVVDTLTGEKKEHLRKISELRNNVKFQQETAAQMDADISEANVSMGPLKK